MRRYLSTLLGLTLAATPLKAHGLRDKISQLFIFADGKDPLFLGGTAGSDSATALHADHFVPSAVSDNGTLISFIGTAISQNVANLPVSATSGGSTFRFEGGVPVPTSRSPGSVFSERAQTLGRGRVFIGANVNRLHLETLRGVSLNGIEMTFTHQNVTGPSCDSLVGASCAPYGVPTHENDVIGLRRFGAFSPHANLGYLYRSGSTQNNAVLATLGFDHLMAPWATMAVDLVSELQVGESKLRLPGPVTYDLPFRRTINVTNLPNERDDLINGSFGFKFTTRAGVTLVDNTMFPLNRRGLRPNVVWTAGLEYNF